MLCFFTTKIYHKNNNIINRLNHTTISKPHLSFLTSHHTTHNTSHPLHHTTPPTTHYTPHNTPHPLQHTGPPTTDHTLHNIPNFLQHTKPLPTHHTTHNTPHLSQNFIKLDNILSFILYYSTTPRLFTHLHPFFPTTSSLSYHPVIHSKPNYSTHPRPTIPPTPFTPPTHTAHDPHYIQNLITQTT